MSLRVRTALLGVLIAAIAAFGASGSSYLYFAHRTDQNVNDSLSIVTTFFKDEVRRSPLADPITGQDLGQYSVQAVDADGKRLSISGIELPIVPRDIDVALGRVGFDTKEVEIEGATWRIRTTSTRYGAIQVGINYDEAVGALDDLRWIIVLIGSCAAIVGAGVSWFITRRSLAPLQDLTTAVELVASGRLDVEVAGRGSSEVNRLANAFNTTIAALRRSRAEQQRLVQDAGHDLRTPLTGLLNNISVLGRHRLSDEDQAVVVADLADDARALKNLVDEIVDVAIGVHGEDAPEPTDIVSVVTDLVAREARRSGRSITLSGDTNAVADVQQQPFERAVLNLIGNAVKYSEDGVEVTIRREDDLIWLDVADRGVGLHGVDPAQLFQRFWRADSARASSGSGLGLAIVKDVAERHGGTVRASERPGGGAVVGFSVLSN